jgi:serine/threonine protein kinase/Flp pilus assembly protein TadD
MTDGSSAIADDLSQEVSAIQRLTSQQKMRLANVLDQYLISLENGVPESVEAIIAQHQDLEPSIRAYIGGLHDLHNIAAGFIPTDSTAQHVESDERRLGDFRLVREIRRGGMGIVYEAIQESLGRRVALKFLPFASVLDGRQIARFKNEAHAAAQLSHPNIVPVYYVGSENGAHFFAMQYIDGEALDEWIHRHQERGGVTDLRQVVQMGIQAATALHAAHCEGIIHRDVKPSNLLLDRDGKLWVTDFGLARCQTEATLTMTRTGNVLGTLRYMSPEQAAGEAALVDGRADIYSLGATLYELICLQPLHPGDDARAILRHMDANRSRPMRALRSDVPRALQTVIAKALATNRDGRYETASQFAQDLQRVLDGEPTLAAPPSIVDYLAAFASRHRSMVFSSALFGCLALVGFAASTAMIAGLKRRSDLIAAQLNLTAKDAREAIDRQLQVAQELAKIPSAAKVRKQLLQETLSYYEKFVQRAAANPSLDNDPLLLQDLAITYGKIGSLNSEVGNEEAALPALARCHAILAQLVDQNPDNKELRGWLANSLTNYGLALHNAGQADTAELNYLQAIQLLEDQQTPSTVQNQLDLAMTRNNLGLLYASLNRVQAAEQEYKLSSALLTEQSTAGETPELTSLIAEHRATVHNNWSNLLLKSNPVQAAEHARSSLNHLSSILTQQPTDPNLAASTALSLNSLAAAYDQSSQHDEAVAAYEQAVEIQQQLVDRWPQQASFVSDLAVTHNNLGQSLMAKGLFSGAEREFERAIEIQKNLVLSFPHDANINSGLGGFLNNLAFALQKTGDVETAVQCYQQAVHHQQQALQLAPLNPVYREHLNKHYFNYGKLLLQLKRFEQALLLARNRSQLWPDNGERLLTIAEEVAIILTANSSTRLSTQNSFAVECQQFVAETLDRVIATGYDIPHDLWNRPGFHGLERK